MSHEPDELYTLRAQYTLGHYALAVQEAKEVSRRPMAANLKIEREEYLNRAYCALRQFDKCATAPGDGAGKRFYVIVVSLFCWNLLLIFISCKKSTITEHEQS